MDIDAAAGQECGQIIRQDLHIACQHDQFRAGFGHQRLDLCFLVRLAVAGKGEMVKGNVADIGRFEPVARVVADNADHIHRQFADPLAVEQVAQAMVESGDHDHHLWPSLAVSQFPFHPLFRGKGAERIGNRCGPRARCQLEHHTHEEIVGLAVVELLRVDNIAAMVGQYLGHAGHQPRLVGAGQGQYLAVRRHGLHSQPEKWSGLHAIKGLVWLDISGRATLF